MMTPKRTPTLSAGESGGVLIREPFWSKAQSLAAAPGSKGVQRDGNPHHNPPTKCLVEVYLKSLVKPMFPRYRYKKYNENLRVSPKTAAHVPGHSQSVPPLSLGAAQGRKTSRRLDPKNGRLHHLLQLQGHLLLALHLKLDPETGADPTKMVVPLVAGPCKSSQKWKSNLQFLVKTPGGSKALTGPNPMRSPFWSQLCRALSKWFGLDPTFHPRLAATRKPRTGMDRFLV